MDDWTIRRAHAGDAEGLGRCFDAAYAPYAEVIDDLPPMSDGCAEEIAKHLVWVAEAGDAIVGGLVLVPADGFVQLANVAVHPDYWDASSCGSQRARHGIADMPNCASTPMRTWRRPFASTRATAGPS